MNHFFNAFCKVPFGQRHEVFSASYEGTLPNGKTTITGEVSGVKDFPRNYGYTFGAGHDIWLQDKCLTNSQNNSIQNSYNYKGKSYALTGGNYFTTLDYIVYQVIFE